MGADTVKGLILQGIGGFYYVKTADGVLECHAKGIFRKQKITPLAGDSVMVEKGETSMVAEILPRRNSFSRPPVANVTRLFIVVSTVQPTPNYAVTDKLCAVSYSKGVTPVLLLAKTDLSDAAEFCAVYSQAGIKLIDCSVGRQDGLEELRALLGDGINVFIGNSGVGKSSLLNRISPDFNRLTGETSKALGRGRHTTRSVELLPFSGGWLADTPGFSSVDIENTERIKKEQLADCFPEFRPYKDDCRFADCSHTKEKGCAVAQAVQDSFISPRRYKNYCDFYEAAKQLKDWE